MRFPGVLRIGDNDPLRETDTLATLRDAHPPNYMLGGPTPVAMHVRWVYAVEPASQACPARVFDMHPSKIYELRIALCRHCGAANDVARAKCNHCGEALHVRSAHRTEASNDSVPDVMCEENLAGPHQDPPPRSVPREKPNPLPPHAHHEEAFTIHLDADATVAASETGAARHDRAGATLITAAASGPTDANQATTRSVTAELRAMFAPDGAGALGDTASNGGIDHAAAPDAPRASSFRRVGGLVLAGLVASVLAGLVASGFSVYQQGSQADLSRLVNKDGPSQVPVAPPAEDTPMPPAVAAPPPVAAAPALRVPERAPRSRADRRVARRLDPAGPTRQAAPDPARRAVVTTNDKGPSSGLGPCTAGVAALGLCTLEPTKGGN